jgi:Sulfotransferase family
VTVAKTFLLGTGAQKSGTTWLYHYLKASPQFVSGYRKEYHVFDALDVEGQAHRRTRALDAARAAQERHGDGSPRTAQAMHLASMYADLDVYFDYFAGLLDSRTDARLTADVTPAYAMLSAERMTQIKQAFASRGVRTVSVFLMRDPVDRIVSHIRMQVREKPQRWNKPVHEVLLDRYAHRENVQRTSYHLTLAELDRAFDPSEVLIGFYEDLFSESRIREICDLVGVDFHPPMLDERQNASPPAQVPEELLRTVAGHYREVYEAVAARFPDLDLEALWPSTRYLR